MPNLTASLEPLDHARLQDLAQWDGDMMLTLTMPAYERGAETQQNPIRFKNLRREAAERCPADRFQSVFRELDAAQHNDTFWQHQKRGLAFVSNGQRSTWLSSDQALPESVTLDRLPNLRSLLPGADENLEVAVLLLTWESADLRLFHAGKLQEESLGAFPFQFHELVQRRDPEEQLQFRSHQPSGASSRGGGEVMYHGHGQGEDKVGADRLQFLHRVAAEAEQVLYQQHRTTILVATEEVAGHFDQLAQLQPLEKITASPDGLPEDVLHQRLGQTQDELAAKQLCQFEEVYAAAASEDRLIRDGVDIAEAAVAGRIDQLLIAENGSLLGTLDPQNLQAKATPDGSDLLNAAAVHTLRAGGSVQLLEQLPGKAHHAIAYLRY